MQGNEKTSLGKKDESNFITVDNTEIVGNSDEVSLCKLSIIIGIFFDMSVLFNFIYSFLL